MNAFIEIALFLFTSCLLGWAVGICGVMALVFLEYKVEQPWYLSTWGWHWRFTVIGIITKIFLHKAGVDMGKFFE